MHVCICLSACVYVSSIYIYIYIYLYILNLYICISLSVCPSVCLPSWLAVCLSAFAHLSLFCLCVCLICPSCLIRICLTHLSYVFYLSFIAISILSIYIYTMPRFSPIVSIVLLSHQHLPNSSIYLSIDLRIYILFYQILFNPMYPIYPTMPCIYPVSIHLMRTVRLDRKSRPSSLILFFKHPTPPI